MKKTTIFKILLPSTLTLILLIGLVIQNVYLYDQLKVADQKIENYRQQVIVDKKETDKAITASVEKLTKEEAENIMIQDYINHENIVSTYGFGYIEKVQEIFYPDGWTYMYGVQSDGKMGHTLIAH